MTKVIIIGGGFGGLNAAKGLKNAPVEILLFDKANHHLFQPLLYQVATAALSISHIASPLREILKNQSNVTVLMELIETIDKQTKKIRTSSGVWYEFDYLIIAPGSNHSYFGHPEWEAFAPGIKDAEDAIRIREKMLLTFEKAESCEDQFEADKYLSFAVIGAGPTGVEMAGSISELARGTLFKNFRRISPEKSHIYLIDAASQVLPTYPLELGEKAKQDLEKLGVNVILNAPVTEINSEGIKFQNQFLPVKNILWAAGNQTSPLIKTLDVRLDKQGRAIVDSDMSIPQYSNIFVIGDAACFMNPQGISLPGIAPVAIQQARYVAKLIKSEIEKKPEKRKPFKYFDKGMISTIGRGKAVGVFRKIKMSGFSAWMVWCFVHVFYLVSFRHRFLVLFHWIILYFANVRQVRIILKALK